MEEKKYQKELFEFEKPKRSFPRLADIFPKPDFEGKILLTFTLEKAVLVSIGIIMLMVVVYAFGVERGKAISPAARAIKTGEDASVKAQVAKSAITMPAAQRPAAPAAKASAETPSPLPVSMPAQDMARPYTIVAATFRNSQTASQEVQRVKRQGLDAYVAQSDYYFQVCAGAYPDKDSVGSKKSLARVRQLYKDAYFKLR